MLGMVTGEWKGVTVALKVISVPVSQYGQVQWQQVLGEAAIATLLNHPCVLHVCFARDGVSVVKDNVPPWKGHQLADSRAITAVSRHTQARLLSV